MFTMPWRYVFVRSRALVFSSVTVSWIVFFFEMVTVAFVNNRGHVSKRWQPFFFVTICLCSPTKDYVHPLAPTSSFVNNRQSYILVDRMQWFVLPSFRFRLVSSGLILASLRSCFVFSANNVGVRFRFFFHFFFHFFLTFPCSLRFVSFRIGLSGIINDFRRDIGLKPVVRGASLVRRTHTPMTYCMSQHLAPKPTVSDCVEGGKRKEEEKGGGGRKRRRRRRVRRGETYWSEWDEDRSHGVTVFFNFIFFLFRTGAHTLTLSGFGFWISSQITSHQR